MPNLNDHPQNSPNFKQMLKNINVTGKNMWQLIKQVINHQYSELSYLNIAYGWKICNLLTTSNGEFNMKYLQIFASLLLYIVWVLFNMLYNAVILNINIQK